jgi:hypothetical protein
MDPLSAAASVIAVVQIADRIIDLCRAYITGVKDAPAELRAILIAVGSVKCVLEVIELLDTSGEAEVTFQGVKILEKLQGPLAGCKEALNALEGSVSAPVRKCGDWEKEKTCALSDYSGMAIQEREGLEVPRGDWAPQVNNSTWFDDRGCVSKNKYRFQETQTDSNCL